MRRLHGHLARAVTLGSLGACLAAPLRATDDGGAASGPAIPPGQEELLLAMLGRGASLPDRCTLSDGQIDHTVVKATYTCPLGDVVVDLSHPDQAPENATETERFALVVDSGSPPESLLDALAANVRRREGEFEWLWPAGLAMPVGGESGEGLAPDEPRW
jgi:hypothetical protein